MHHNNRHAVLLLVSLALISFSCNRRPRNEKRYPIEGKVVTVNKTDRTATINHKDIQGYMPGMTMEFKIKRDSDLEMIRPGDLITGTLVVDESSSWVEITSSTDGG